MEKTKIEWKEKKQKITLHKQISSLIRLSFVMFLRKQKIKANKKTQIISKLGSRETEKMTKLFKKFRINDIIYINE